MWDTNIKQIQRILIHFDGTHLRLFTEILEDWFFFKPDLMLEQIIHKNQQNILTQTLKRSKQVNLLIFTCLFQIERRQIGNP
ncbi:unnamed protein product [Paramecium sonneborni]|uniref:Uncharacterized protein n=1 Tax=Paramecium sonneborni TaxID=65129 RepID=A0A8S1RUX1_9CILI|nr:unnamed protein product [Paramecium sonneborni]